MGKFVQDKVLAVLVVDGTLMCMRPGQHNRTTRPAFAQSDFFRLSDNKTIMDRLFGFERAGIDQNCTQVPVPGITVHNNQAGLGGDGQPHIVSDLQPVAAVHINLMQEQIDLAVQPFAQPVR